ncbi:MAG: metallophosphoesterase [Bacteroidales bacterium]|nr:metallophosphoesterase [Bacteroidales bacterium]
MFKTDKLPTKRNLLHLQKLRVLFLLLAFSAISVLAGEKVRLVILHTNDTHSQVEPTEKSTLKTADMGGYARRMGVIQKIRSEEKNVLLLDAGDFSQGTPYFNFYNGRIEIDAINRMKYDAGTLGNHEFDNGIDTLSVILAKAKFPFISSNYDVSKTPIEKFIRPYLILKKAGLKIGIMALNIEPKSLIIESNYRGLIYNNPVEKAKEMSAFLKNNKKCNFVICLSHLGSDSTSVAVNDFDIAHETKYIDIIIGGHSHTLLENTKTNNAAGKPVVIAQMGKSGLYLGRIDLELEKKK